MTDNSTGEPDRRPPPHALTPVQTAAKQQQLSRKHGVCAIGSFLSFLLAALQLILFTGTVFYLWPKARSSVDFSKTYHLLIFGLSAGILLAFSLSIILGSVSLFQKDRKRFLGIAGLVLSVTTVAMLALAFVCLLVNGFMKAGSNFR